MNDSVTAFLAGITFGYLIGVVVVEYLLHRKPTKRKEPNA